MITWWGWLLIWLGLALLMVGMLALFAWRLFRQFLTLVDDLAALTDRLDILGATHESPPRLTFGLAVLAATHDVRERERVRSAGRRLRRVERHARRIARATAIGSVDVSQTDWPLSWYAPRRSRGRKPRDSKD